MKQGFRTSILIGLSICGLALQTTCPAQNAAPASVPSPLPSAPVSVPPIRTILTELAANKEPGMGVSTTAPASTVSATATTAGATVVPSASGTAATAPAVVAVPLNTDAVIKELAEMKARIAQLEAELKVRPAEATVSPVATSSTATVAAAQSPQQPSAAEKGDQSEETDGSSGTRRGGSG